MKKFILFVGLNDKDTKKQKISTKKAINIIVSTIQANHLQGCTISQSIGFYTHTNNTMVVEKSLKVEIFTSNLKAIKSLISTLKTVLNQESIIYQSEQINSKVA